MKLCPACQAEAADDARFCLVCGHALSAPAVSAYETPEQPAGEEAPLVSEPEEAPAEEPPVFLFEDPAPESEPVPEPEPGETPAPEKRGGALNTWQYFLLELLFAVPLIGTVCLFIFSLGRPRNGSLRDFAASRLIWRLIFYIVLVALLLLLMFNFRHWGDAFTRFVSTLSAAR